MGPSRPVPPDARTSLPFIVHRHIFLANAKAASPWETFKRRRRYWSRRMCI